MRICTQLSLVALVLAALLQFTVVRSVDTGAANSMAQKNAVARRKTALQPQNDAVTLTLAPLSAGVVTLIRQ